MKEMDKRKTIKQVAKEEEEQKQKKNHKEIFASCSFSSLGLHPTLCEQLRDRMGFAAPTLIQAQAIPVILSGRHVLVNAATGTGKTVTYLAPIIHHLQQYDPRIQRSDGTFALVLVPTHELCMQVYEILQKLLHRFHWIVPGYIMGGENRSKEKARLRKGISILVATPGRLLDHLKHTSSFVHANLRWIIFDEADRILELGFGKEIEEILDLLGSRHNKPVGEEDNAVSKKVSDFQRQNLLLSATLNEKVNHLAKMSLANPVMIGIDEKKKMQPNPSQEHIGSLESDVDDDALQRSGTMLSTSNGEYKLPAQLIQRYVKVSCGSRLVVILSILKNLFAGDASQKIVVFFSTCDAVDFHYSLLSEFKWQSNLQSEAEPFVGCKTFRLHGNMKHEDRRTTFNAFKTEKTALLLSTDVAARGLDFPKVRCIIQYDSPGEATEYVHRVGRTARLGERGESLLFLQPIEIDYLKDLEKHGVLLTEYPLLKLLDSFPLFGQKPHPKKFVSLEMHPWVLSLQKALESFVLKEPSMKKLAQSAFCSWVRAYSAHRGELKGIFMVKKLHLGHVARSFALKEQPSFVGKSFQNQTKKRKKMELTHKGGLGVFNKKRKVN